MRRSLERRGARSPRSTRDLTNVVTFICNLERLKVDPDHDQFVINRLFDSNPELLNKHGYGLNKLLFANGDTYFHKQMNKKLGIQPMTIHANYLIGFDKKKCNLIQANMWYL